MFVEHEDVCEHIHDGACRAAHRFGALRDGAAQQLFSAVYMLVLSQTWSWSQACSHLKSMFVLKTQYRNRSFKLPVISVGYLYNHT